jgi:hypothetical protein
MVNHSSTLPYGQAFFLQSDCEHTSQLLTTHHVCDGDGGDDAVIDELLCRTPVLRSSGTAHGSCHLMLTLPVVEDGGRS